jgi:glutamate transport system permease protein
VSAGVLFDAPGPRTVARHRIYTVIAAVALLGLLAFFVYRLWSRDQFEYDKWEVFVTPTYVRSLLVDGLLTTLRMAVTAIVLAVVFGAVFGLGKLSDHRWIRLPCWAVVEFFRAVPVLLLMVLIFFTYGINRAGVEYWSVVIALTLYNGAVLAEVFRAGVLAVPKGQSEAAYAIGLRKVQVTNLVLLPQAVKIMIPAIISQCVVALKDTSLGYAVAAPGLTQVGQRIYTGFNNQVPTILVVASLYIAVNLVLTALASWVQRRYVGEKKPLEVSMVAETDAGSGLDSAPR